MFSAMSPTTAADEDVLWRRVNKTLTAGEGECEAAAAAAAAAVAGTTPTTAPAGGDESLTRCFAGSVDVAAAFQKSLQVGAPAVFVPPPAE